MDREADSYVTLTRLIEAGARFVIRLCRDKTLVTDELAFPGEMLLFAAAEHAPVVTRRSVPLSVRPPHRSRLVRKVHPPRAERTATLQLKATRVEIRRPHRPRYKVGFPQSLTVNIVRVDEIDAPADQAPVSWTLVTTEPIETAAEIEAVVDAYRARWTIEEFFKALKTGCAYQQRQLESFRTLANALAVFSVIAWRLLLLRSVSRSNPNVAATEALTARQVRVLQQLSVMRGPGIPRVEMPESPTAQDALLAVAQLGGRLNSNGPPGWQVLGRGYESLLLIELGWLAREGCDR
jgi:hypothetical protein